METKETKEAEQSKAESTAKVVEQAKAKPVGEVDVTQKITRYLRWGVVALVLLIGLAVGGAWAYQHRRPPVVMTDAIVKEAATVVTAPGNAKVVALQVENGDHVEAGDVLMTLEPAVTDEDVARLEQNAEMAKDSLASLRRGIPVTREITIPAAPAPAPVAPTPSVSSAEVSQARARMERMNELFAMGAVSARQKDEAAAAYQSALAGSQVSAPAPPPSSAPTVSYETVMQPASAEQIQQAELLVKQADIALANAKKAHDMTEVRASVAGTVQFADGIGPNVQVQAGTELANIYDPNDMWIEAQVPTATAEKLSLGQTLAYIVDGQRYVGAVRELAPIEPPTADASADANANGDGNAEASGDNTSANGENATPDQAQVPAKENAPAVGVPLPKEEGFAPSAEHKEAQTSDTASNSASTDTNATGEATSSNGSGTGTDEAPQAEQETIIRLAVNQDDVQSLPVNAEAQIELTP